MSVPGWLGRELDTVGAQHAERLITRAEAVAALRDLIMQRADAALRLAITAEFASRALADWDRQHRAAFPPLSLQSELFPGLPRRLKVTPARSVAVAAMSRHDLDMARNILWARTGNAMDGAKKAAEHERAVFTAFYDKVRPLLDGDLTVADVLGGLRDGEAAAP